MSEFEKLKTSEKSIVIVSIAIIFFALLMSGCKSQKQTVAHAQTAVTTVAETSESHASASSDSASAIVQAWMSGATATFTADSLVLADGTKIYNPAIAAGIDKADYKSAVEIAAASTSADASSSALAASAASNSDLEETEDATAIAEPAGKLWIALAIIAALMALWAWVAWVMWKRNNCEIDNG